MEANDYEVMDRRPIAARRLSIMSQLATALVRAHPSANGISVAGMICGILAGVCLYCTVPAAGLPRHFLWLAGAVFIQLRLLANLLDGMVAIASRTASQVGELFNDAPDRVSDSATLIGLGYALGGIPVLGWCAALLSISTAYVRLLGKAAGAGSDFRGPMAKQHRMFLATVVSLFCAVAPTEYQYRAPTFGLVVICAGCVVTVFRRLSGIAKNLRSKA